MFALGVAKGSTTAGGADSSGYISEAVAITHGRLTKDAPLIRHLSLPDRHWVVAPLGWRPSTRPGVIAPIYPSGYPLTLAAALKMGGPRAIFWVVPALGALAVWCTYLLGRRLDTEATGAFAAALLASSPPFVFQALQPMSDVPATAWWLAATVLAAAGSSRAIGLAGLAAGLAVLTRPNLAPIGAAIALYLAAGFTFRRGASVRERVRPVWFVIPYVAAGLAVAIMQNQLYGSPFKSGYGTFETLYASEYFATNVRLYSAWLLETETSLVFLAAAAPIVLWRRPADDGHDAGRARLMALAFAIVLIVLVSYLFYFPFDNWTFLRFLLPAYPALFVLTAMAVRRGVASISARVALVFLAAVSAVIMIRHVTHIEKSNVLNIRVSEHRYEVLTTYMGTRVLGRPVFIGLQFTGSLAHYTGRPTLRWDWIAPDWLDRSVAELDQSGYRPLILLEQYEEKEFRDRFVNQVFGKLDWPPRAMMTTGASVRLWDPADRELHLKGQTWRIDQIE